MHHIEANKHKPNDKLVLSVLIIEQLKIELMVKETVCDSTCFFKWHYSKQCTNRWPNVRNT